MAPLISRMPTKPALASRHFPLLPDNSAEPGCCRAQAEFECRAGRLNWLIACEEFKRAAWRFESRRRKANFDPSEPRDDLGKWTDAGGANRVRLVSSDKPSLGRASMLALATQVAKRLIEVFRSENGLFDLFGRSSGTVSIATVDGTNFYGSNSRSPTYSSEDRVATEDMRDTLIEKYPDIMNSENIGGKPNDALFHAEATVLLRAARANGGTLAGKTFEVFSDRAMCPSCVEVLPLIGKEVGNPIVTFVGPNGIAATMRDGAWLR